MLESGANPNAENTYTQTPLHKAARSGHQEIAELLLDIGADVNARTLAGRTPLHEAADTGQLEAVRSLVTNGANILAKTISGETALALARRRNQYAVAQELATKRREDLQPILNQPVFGLPYVLQNIIMNYVIEFESNSDSSSHGQNE